MFPRLLAVCLEGQLIVLLDIKQSAEELTLEDIDDSVQRLLQLAVFLHRAVVGPVLVLLSLI